MNNQEITPNGINTYILLAKNYVEFSLKALHYIFNPGENFSNKYEKSIYYFFYIDTLLSVCGKITSLIFFRIDKRYYKVNDKNTNRQKKSLELCTALNISEKDYYLLKKRYARNFDTHIEEHYDEHNGMLGDYNIIDEDTADDIKENIKKHTHFRTYYPNIKIFEISSEKVRINFFELKEEIESLKTKIDEYLVING